MGCSLLVLIYSVAVLTHVAWMGTIGVRCMFGTKVEEVIPADYVWGSDRPRIGDSLVTIGRFDIHEKNYGDYIRALRRLERPDWRHGRSQWRDQNTGTAIPPKSSFNTLRRGLIIGRASGSFRSC